MTDANDWNRQIIEEFRANEGKVGGQFAGAPLVLLTTTGARSGQPWTSPMMYLDDGGRRYVFASKAGAPTNPDWYHNLRPTRRSPSRWGPTSFAPPPER